MEFLCISGLEYLDETGYPYLLCVLEIDLKLLKVIFYVFHQSQKLFGFYIVPRLELTLFYKCPDCINGPFLKSLSVFPLPQNSPCHILNQLFVKKVVGKGPCSLKVEIILMQKGMAVSSLAIPARPSHLLNVGFKRVRHIVVDDRPKASMVNSHCQRDSGHYRFQRDMQLVGVFNEALAVLYIGREELLKGIESLVLGLASIEAGRL